MVNSFVSNQQIVSNENGMKSRSHNEYISLTPVKANRIRFPQKQKETEDFFQGIIYFKPREQEVAGCAQFFIGQLCCDKNNIASH